jgi:hypothetical protein
MSPDSESGQAVLRSRDLHVELDAELQANKNARSARSMDMIVNFAGISFNWRDSSPKNLKSNCSSRHKTALFPSPGRKESKETVPFQSRQAQNMH